MTPLERAQAYARGDLVDRVPTTLSAGETIPPLYGIPICDYYFSADLMVEVETRMAEDFQADNMGVGLGLRTVIEALGTKLTYLPDAVAIISEPVLADIHDVDCLDVVDASRDGRLPIIAESFERLQDRFGKVRTFGSGLAGPFTTAAGLCGTEVLLKAMIRDKEAAHKVLQFACDCVVACSRDLHKRLGIGFMLSEPMGARDLIGKRQFEEFFLPYLRQAVARMNEFQGKTSLHICGHTFDRWDDIMDSGICSFWIDDCESMGELKRRYGERVAVVGNLPPVDVLKDGTPDAISEGVRRCIADAADNPCGYTLSPGCTTPAATPRENIIAYMNAAATWGAGARKGCLPEGLSR